MRGGTGGKRRVHNKAPVFDVVKRSSLRIVSRTRCNTKRCFAEPGPRQATASLAIPVPRSGVRTPHRARDTNASDGLPQIAAKALDAFAGVFEIGGPGRI